jgi:hypothetical protein
MRPANPNGPHTEAFVIAITIAVLVVAVLVHLIAQLF